MKKAQVSLKKAGVLFMMLIATLSANAQFLRSSYFMEDAHQRMQLNPALMPTRGYINIPVVGSLFVSANSNTLGTSDIMDIIDNGDGFYSNSDFMNKLSDKNHLNVNLSTEILSAGWYKGKNFWSVNLGLRTDIGAQITRSMFSFLNQMDAVEDNWRNSSYDISGQQLNINAYTELGVGYARQINDRLSVGGKLKFLAGIGDMSLKINNMKMSANLPTDADIAELENYAWSNDPIELRQQATKKANEIGAYHANLDVNAELTSSFKGMSLTQEEGQDYASDFDFDSGELGIAGYGIGIDLGASYKVLDNLNVSASVLDLGFISWSKGSTTMAYAKPEAININGADYTTGIADATTADEAKQILTDNLNRLQEDYTNYQDLVTNGEVLDYDMLGLQETGKSKSRTTSLAATVVAGAEYGFLDNKLGVGLLSTTRFLKPNTMTELTLSGNYRPKDWLNVTLSYSMIQSAGKSVGFALKLGPVFIGTDYMFFGNKTKAANGFIGISVPLGGRKG